MVVKDQTAGEFIAASCLELLQAFEIRRRHGSGRLDFHADHAPACVLDNDIDLAAFLVAEMEEP